MKQRQTCSGCRDDLPLGFAFEMAFQPIVDVAAQRIWGHEALVRGPNGESAASILANVTEDNRYRFDQTLPRQGDRGRGPAVRRRGPAAVDQFHAQCGLRTGRVHSHLA